MQEEEVHIVMSDQRMPQITGRRALTKVKSQYPQAVRMLFTGFADLESIIAAINQGHIFGFLQEAMAARGARGGGAAGRRRIRPADRGGRERERLCSSRSTNLQTRLTSLENEVSRRADSCPASRRRADGA